MRVGGGGIKGLAYIGALERMEYYKLLKNVRNYAGVSIGAVFATMLAIGYSVAETSEIMLGANFEDFMDDKCGLLRDAVSIMSKYGYCEGKVFYEFMTDIIKKKTGNALYTFGELYKDRQVKLIIIGCNVNRMREIRFSKEIYPDMSILNAVRISMALPLVFRPIQMNRDYYIDGGVINNYPLNVFNRQTVGLKLMSAVEERENIANIVGFISIMMSIPTKRDVYDERSIIINTSGISVIDFKMPDEKKIELIEEGKRAVDNWLGTGAT